MALAELLRLGIESHLGQNNPELIDGYLGPRTEFVVFFWDHRHGDPVTCLDAIRDKCTDAKVIVFNPESGYTWQPDDGNTTQQFIMCPRRGGVLNFDWYWNALQKAGLVDDTAVDRETCRSLVNQEVKRWNFTPHLPKSEAFLRVSGA